MADTFHSDMCLHPARRDKGELGKKIDYALLWNGDCPVQQIGRPAFYGLLDLNLPVEKWELAGEHLRRKIVAHFEREGSITKPVIVIARGEPKPRAKRRGSDRSNLDEVIFTP